MTTDIHNAIDVPLACGHAAEALATDICRDVCDIDREDVLQAFHEHHIGEGPHKFYSDVWARAAEGDKRVTVERWFEVFAWLDRLVPCEVSPQGTVRSLIMAATMTNGRLVRTNLAAWCDKQKIDRGRERRNVALNVHDTWLSYEEQAIGLWGEEARAANHRVSCRTAALVGAGVLGALDGVISPPWLVYNEWSEPRSLSVRQLIMLRLITGTGFGVERRTAGHNCHAWVECDRQILAAYSVLDNLRRSDPLAFEAWVHRNVIKLYADWGKHGWLFHEIESGDVPCPSAIVSPRAVWLMHQILDRAVAIYKHTYGVK